MPSADEDVYRDALKRQSAADAGDQGNAEREPRGRWARWTRRRRLTTVAGVVLIIAGCGYILFHFLRPKAGRCFDRGVAALKRGEHDAAIDLFTKAISLDPDTVSAYWNRALAYERRPDYRRAIEDYTRVIEMLPWTPHVWARRGYAHEMVGLRDRALEDYTEAIRLAPDKGYTFRDRGWLYRMEGDYTKAITDYTKAIELDHTDSTSLVARALCLKGLKRYQEALRDYREAVRVGPGDARARRTYAWFLATCPDRTYRDRQEALVQIGMAVTLDSRNAANLVRRADILAGLNRPEDAVRDYTEAIRVDPDDHWARNEYAWFLATCTDAEYRDGAKAVKHALKANELYGGQNAYLLGTLAAAYAESGDFAKAVECQEQALAVETTGYDTEAALKRLDLYKAGKPYREAP